MLNNDEFNSISDIGEITRKRQKANYDVVIGVTGYEGVGKTTLATLLGLDIGKITLRKKQLKFVEENVIYNPNAEQIQEAILHDKLPRYSPVVVDEAIKTMYKRQWQSKVNTYITQIFAICRKRNKAIILCMPRFGDFDSFFRQGRILIWIHVIRRGYAVVFMKDWSPFITDAWHLDKNEKLIKQSIGRKKVKDITPDMKLSALRKCKNYCGEFVFPAMPEHVEKRYKELADKVRFELEQQDEGGLLATYRKACGALIAQLYKRVKITQIEIAACSHLSLGQVNRLLKLEQARKHD